MADQEHRRNTTTMRHLRWDARFGTDEEAEATLAVHLRTDHGLLAPTDRGFRVIDRWHDDDHLAGQREKADATGRVKPFDDLYDEVIDVCTWAREHGCPLAYDWIMERFAEYQEGERLLPVTPSRADRQPPDPVVGANSG